MTTLREKKINRSAHAARDGSSPRGQRVLFTGQKKIASMGLQAKLLSLNLKLCEEGPPTAEEKRRQLDLLSDVLQTLGRRRRQIQREGNPPECELV